MTERPRPRLVVPVCSVAALVAGGIAVAAANSVIPEKLTIFAYCRLTNAPIDSYVDQSSAATNFGGSADLLVRSRSSSRNARTFVQFAPAACSIPATAQVTAASAGLYMTTPPSSSRTYEIRRVSASWVEGTLTWYNQPAVGGVSATVSTGTTANVRLSWAVASDVQAWVDGSAANDGWRVSDQTENASGTGVSALFASDEHGTASSRPLLTIQYYP
jgi:hypothetical protein